MHILHKSIKYEVKQQVQMYRLSQGTQIQTKHKLRCPQKSETHEASINNVYKHQFHSRLQECRHLRKVAGM